MTPLAPTSGAPVISLSDAASKIVLKPKTLSFSSAGTIKTVTVIDKGYTGKIAAAAASCNGVAAISPSRGKGPKYKAKITSRGAGSCFIVFSDKHHNKANLSIDVTTTSPSSSPSTKPSGSPSTSPSGSPSTKPSSSPSTKPSTSPSPTGSPTLGPVVASPAAATVCPSSGAAMCSSDTQTIALSQAHYSGSFTHSTGCSTSVATVVGSGSSYTITGKTTPGTCSATFIGGGGKFATVPVTVVGAVVASPSPAYVCPSSSSSCDTQVVTISQSNYSGSFTENDTCSGSGTPIATVVKQTTNTYLITGGVTDNKSCTATFTGTLGEKIVLSIQVSSGIGVH